MKIDISVILHVPNIVPQKRSLNFYCPSPHMSRCTPVTPGQPVLYTCTHRYCAAVHTHSAPSSPELSWCQHSWQITPGRQFLVSGDYWNFWWDEKYKVTQLWEQLRVKILLEKMVLSSTLWKVDIIVAKNFHRFWKSFCLRWMLSLRICSDQIISYLWTKI